MFDSKSVNSQEEIFIYDDYFVLVLRFGTAAPLKNHFIRTCNEKINQFSGKASRFAEKNA